jgi:RimJ/RimL family protein N-acetyltransferase
MGRRRARTPATRIAVARRIGRMRVILRETTLEDVPILFAHQQDPVAAEMAAFESRDWDTFVAHDAKLRLDPTALRRTIVADGEVVGSIGIWGEDEREIGYWIDRAAWGKGIASAAVAALLTEVQDRPLSAHAAEHNVASIRVLERNGFVETGRQQESDVVVVTFLLE